MTTILRITLCVWVITCFLMLWELRDDIKQLGNFIKNLLKKGGTK